MEVTFRALTPWALLPYPVEADARVSEAEAEGAAQSFRWLRRSPSPLLNAPWKTGQETGWVVPCPVDIRMTPFAEAQVSVPPQERALFQEITGMRDFWRRGEEIQLVTEGANWLRLYDGAYEEEWHPLFYPVGVNGVEFRLGWAVEIPSDHFLMVLPWNELAGVSVDYGIVDSKNLNRQNDFFGMSLSMIPRRPTSIRRGQPIARVMLLHTNTLRARARYADTAGALQEESEPQP